MKPFVLARRMPKFCATVVFAGLFLWSTGNPTPLSAAPAKRRHRSPSSGGSDADTLARIWSIENRRVLKDRYLLNALNHPSRRVVKAAMMALGRIGDASALEELSKFLNRKDVDYRETAAAALSLIPDDTALKILVQHLQMQKDPEVLAVIFHAVGRGGNEKSVPTLANALKEYSDDRIPESVCQALGMLWATASEKWAVPDGLTLKLAKLAQEKESVALPCAFALARFKGDNNLLPSAEILDAAAKTASPAARALLMRVVGRLKNSQAAVMLSQQSATSDSIGVRVEALKALSGQPFSDSVQFAFKKSLSDASQAVVFQALESIAYHGPAAISLSDALENVFKNSKSIWIRGTALRALAAVNPKLGRLRAAEFMTTPTSPLFSSAISSLAMNPTDEDLNHFAVFLNHDSIKVIEDCVEGISQMSEDKFIPPIKAGLKKALERVDTAVASLVAQIVEKFRWKDFAGTLAAVYPLFTQPDHVEAKVAILSALGNVGDYSHLSVMEASLKDDEKLVVSAGVDALRAVMGRDESAKIPLNSQQAPTNFTYSEVATALETRVVLKTNRGDIVLKMLDEAPLNALNFIRLVRKKFYDGKTFHRVVPNFVVQGGDPRGDGYGGPGYLVRDEVTLHPQKRGLVGLATAGRDTGGSQFFINLANNLHLDARYTLFAEVASGMDIVDKLEVGDRIISAKVR